ncbi:hypothetical protein HJFPF1_05164 [Paramyrothecium foliicola]|nr:hypothetical protein HJFPF1_05164 [Paramyrothecium foliicola]
MVQTRAQRAAQRVRDSDNHGMLYEALRSTAPPDRGKGRQRAVKDTHDPAPEHLAKRSRPALPADETVVGPIDDEKTCSIGYWVRKGTWPHKFFEADMDHALARKRACSATSTTPSDQKPREEKSAPYRDVRYDTLLMTKGVFMGTSEEGVAEESKRLGRDLLEGEQDLPQGTIFDSDVFKTACVNFHVRNEARIIQDVSRLLVPSAETLSLYNKELRVLTESVNEGWNNSIPLIGTRPQPDYSTGFRPEAFTNNQLTKLAPFIGDFLAGDLSLFMATYYMHFPFLSCEVKCGAVALSIADRQNAHSMALAARGIVELFRLVKREKEVHRQILSFSISHDDRSVRIYGYYPVIEEGKDTRYYRHLIYEFSFIALDGREK